MRHALLIIATGLAWVVILDGLPAADSGQKAPRTVTGVSSKTELEELEALLNRNRADMVHVTDKPYHVAPLRRIDAPPVACAPAFPADKKVSTPSRDPHNGHWIHVLVTPGGREPLTRGTGDYPKGTIILKQKFNDTAGKRTELFTGMLKREPGYASDVGDWEFFTTDASGKKVTSRGQIQHCADCHMSFQESNFVSRIYLPRKKPAGGGGKNAANRPASNG